MPHTVDVADALREAIRVVPDFPQPGVRFQDLAPVFARPDLVRRLAEAFDETFHGTYERIMAVEARGFVLGTALSALADRPLVLARKKGKLPGPVHRAEYVLEYGTATLEMQRDAVRPGDRLLVVDDVLATGGTLAAAAELVAAGGAHVAGFAVASTIAGLGGTESLAPAKVYSVLPAG
ncbi:adenine phosphoribosyltransferase [Streptomyces longisporoflavus]|uniref:Adenine phosphoribosyltransferase n=1 Tax=Streptomyces longisporoflavus TaxID=28044 RepID=A0ABW7R3D9_9ACTN